MKINRPLTEEEFNDVFTKLEDEVKKIEENHSEYFKDTKNPQSIDYAQVSSQTDWTGITVFNVPFISFFDKSLSEEIKNEVRQKFIDIVIEITN